MAKWYNLATFDIIGDLAFGEPFGCLESSNYHPWVATIMDGINNGVYVSELGHYGVPPRLLFALMPASQLAKIREQQAYTDEKVKQRMALPTARPDFMHSMVNKPAAPLDFVELTSNMDAFTIAGSETTATTMCGATFFLTTHPEVYAKLAREVRGAFAEEAEITMLATQHLAYLSAFIEETMRLFHPIPSPVPRVITKGGDVIGGHFLPAGTVVNINHYAMYRSKQYWTLPDSFIPERFLGDARFANDINAKKIFQPFSAGPRNCIGKRYGSICY